MSLYTKQKRGLLKLLFSVIKVNRTRLIISALRRQRQEAYKLNTMNPCLKSRKQTTKTSKQTSAQYPLGLLTAQIFKV